MGLATSQCGNCGGAFDFDLQTFQETGRDGFHILGQTVNCPHCNAETVVTIPIPETPRVILPAAIGSIPEKQQPPARAKGDSIGNFISCPTCRERISTKAASCPKCGHVVRSPGAVNMSDPVHLIGIILCILFLVVCIAAMIWWLRVY